MIPGRGSAHSPTWLKNQSPKQTPWCQDPVGPFRQTQKLDPQLQGLGFCPGSQPTSSSTVKSGMSLFQGVQEISVPSAPSEGSLSSQACA